MYFIGILCDRPTQSGAYLWTGMREDVLSGGGCQRNEWVSDVIIFLSATVP